MRLYVDGKVVASRSDVTGGQDYSGVWRVGGDNLAAWTNQPNSDYFAGTIDDVAIYPTVLDSTQVAAHYAASGRTNPLPQAPADAYGKAVFNLDPALYWRLDEAGGTTAKDRGPRENDGNVYGNVTFGQTGGIFGYSGTSAGFDGNNAHIVAGTSANNPKNYTEGVWFKTTTNLGGKLIGFGSASSGTSGGYDRHIYMQQRRQADLRCLDRASPTRSPRRRPEQRPVALRGRHPEHRPGMRLYVDGELVGTNGQTDAQDYTGYWRIGGDNHWGRCSPFLDGTLDEAAVFATRADRGQVANLYSLGSAPAANQAPVAAFTLTVTNLTASFDGSGSADADGTIASYAWDFGDGSTGTGVSPTHPYATAGTYTVTLTVTDNDGATGTISHSVTVAAPANQLPQCGLHAQREQSARRRSTAPASTDPDGTIASLCLGLR